MYGDQELTGPEITSIWSEYQSITMSICGFKYALQHIHDEEIKILFEDSLNEMENVKKRLTSFFEKESYPVPKGFTDEDVNLNTPELFSEKILLFYVLEASALHLGVLTMNLATATRQDIIDFYNESLTKAQKTHNEAKLLAKKKGILIPAPKIAKPEMTDFVKKQNFLASWFGEQRPLTGIEITNLMISSQQNSLGQAAITAFSQVASSKELRRYFERGRDIAGKHSEIFYTILTNDYLSDGSLNMVPEVTDSTESPFSDRLMLTFVDTLISFGLIQYGNAIAQCSRPDLSLKYTRLATEIANYSRDGAKLLIENGWMEQPPMAPNREKLAK